MQVVPLQALPNQAFSTLLDGNDWDFIIKSTNGVMSVSLALNGAQVISNLRAVAGSPLIPSHYQEAGNFIFVTANGELPNYRKFGVTQKLLYASAAELGVIRTITSPIVTADSFDSNGGLPLRFKPQGY